MLTTKRYQRRLGQAQQYFPLWSLRRHLRRPVRAPPIKAVSFYIFCCRLGALSSSLNRKFLHTRVSFREGNSAYRPRARNCTLRLAFSGEEQTHKEEKSIRIILLFAKWTIGGPMAIGPRYRAASCKDFKWWSSVGGSPFRKSQWVSGGGGSRQSTAKIAQFGHTIGRIPPFRPIGLRSWSTSASLNTKMI